MRRVAPALFAFAILAGPGPARAVQSGFFSGDAPAAPSLADFDAAEGRLADLWETLPYTTRHAMFVSKPADFFGGYERRPTNVFAPGETLRGYVEPVGFHHKRLDDGRLSFGVTTDFEILSHDGKILGGQKAFKSTDLVGHVRNREFFVDLTLTLDGLAPGDYVVAYTLHDHVGGASTRFELPFTIKAT